MDALLPHPCQYPGYCHRHHQFPELRTGRESHEGEKHQHPVGTGSGKITAAPATDRRIGHHIGCLVSCGTGALPVNNATAINTQSAQWLHLIERSQGAHGCHDCHIDRVGPHSRMVPGQIRDLIPARYRAQDIVWAHATGHQVAQHSALLPTSWCP